MSLLTDSMVDCVYRIKTIVPDGMGGYTVVYRDGTTFKAAITFDSSIEAKIAEKQGVTDVYTVTTAKSFTLGYHDVFRRVSDSVTFRVTSDGAENATPSTASLNMRQVSAEKWNEVSV